MVRGMSAHGVRTCPVYFSTRDNLPGHLAICVNNIIIMCTVVPVMNGHPRDQAKVSVHCRWPLIRGNLTLKCVGRGIDNVAVQGRWPLTTGVAQGRYYCIGLVHNIFTRNIYYGVDMKIDNQRIIKHNAIFDIQR